MRGLPDTRGQYPTPAEAEDQARACSSCAAIQLNQYRLDSAMSEASEAIPAARAALALIELRAAELFEAGLSHGRHV